MRNPTSRLLVWLTAAALALAVGCGNDDGGGGDSATDSGASSSSGGASSSSGGASSSSGGDGGASSGSDAGSSGGTDAGSSGSSADTGATLPTCKPHKKPGDHDWGCDPGTKCVYKNSKPACVAAGTKPVGADCQSEEECAVGLCVSNSAGESRCAPYCISGVSCATGKCNKLQSGKGKVCDMGGKAPEQCNPLTQNCTANNACYYTPEGFICMFAGSKDAGQPCPADNECVKATVCVGRSGTTPGVCRALCATGGGAPKCEVGISCSTLGGGVGYCDG